MQPTQPVAKKKDEFQPKWRHFHPLARVWIQNPFDEDIIYQVADEYNRPYRYVLPAHKVSELPGGAIATLGVKHIVDRLIQDTKGDEVHMWDPLVREKHEKSIILRYKDTTPAADSLTPGIVNLGVTSNEVPEPTQEAVKAPEEAFPGLNQPTAAVPAPAPALAPMAAPALAPLPPEVSAAFADTIASSLPTEDATIGANNAGHEDDLDTPEA